MVFEYYPYWMSEPAETCYFCITYVCLSPFTAIVLFVCTVFAVVGDSLLTHGVGIVGVPMLKVSAVF